MLRGVAELEHYRYDAFYCKINSERGAAVAQRVGRWTRDQQVVGSNPPRASRG